MDVLTQLDAYLNQSDERLLQQFKWGSQGESEFAEFMSLIREQLEG